MLKNFERHVQKLPINPFQYLSRQPLELGLVLCCLLFGAVPVFGNSTDSGTSSYANWRERSQTDLDQLAAGQSGVQGALGFDTLGYTYQSSVRSQNIFSSLSINGLAQTEGTIHKALIQGQVQTVYTESKPIFAEVNQAYFGTSSSLAPVQVSFGRKMDRWSALDETWQLGIVQPRYRRDFIHPDPVGLVGAFLSFDSSMVHATAYGSPIFLPERGATVEERDGTLMSSSQWVLPPPRTFDVLAQQTRIKYRLDIPPIGELISKPNVGGLIRVGEETGFWGRTSYTYKPVNQILISYNAFLLLEERPEDQHVEATIRPLVVYHHVGALDFGYEREKWGAWIGGVVDRPIQSDQVIPAGWTGQRFGNAWGASLGGRYDFAFLSYLHQDGGNLSDQGEFASGNGSLFEERYPFQDAFRLGADLSLSRQVSYSTSLTLDVGHRGAIWTNLLKYSPYRHWSVVGGGDWIGAARADVNHFFSRYQANSSIHGGVNYVF